MLCVMVCEMLSVMLWMVMMMVILCSLGDFGNRWMDLSSSLFHETMKMRSLGS